MYRAVQAMPNTGSGGVNQGLRRDRYLQQQQQQQAAPHTMLLRLPSPLWLRSCSQYPGTTQTAAIDGKQLCKMVTNTLNCHYHHGMILW
jgi:hypothetical protein